MDRAIGGNLPNYGKDARYKPRRQFQHIRATGAVRIRAALKPVYAELSFSLIAAPLWSVLSFLSPGNTIDLPLYAAVRNMGSPLFWQAFFMAGFVFSLLGVALRRGLLRCIGAALLTYGYCVMASAIAMTWPWPLSLAFYVAGTCAEISVVIWQVRLYVRGKAGLSARGGK